MGEGSIRGGSALARQLAAGGVSVVVLFLPSRLVLHRLLHCGYSLVVGFLGHMAGQPMGSRVLLCAMPVFNT
jgi:hypothetical protein